MYVSLMTSPPPSSIEGMRMIQNWSKKKKKKATYSSYTFERSSSLGPYILWNWRQGYQILLLFFVV